MIIWLNGTFGAGGSWSPSSRARSPGSPASTRQWRLDHIVGYLAARDWMAATADVVIDSTTRSVPEVARLIRAAVPLGG